MFELVTGAPEIRRARNALFEAFRRKSSRTELKLSTPGGAFDAEVMYREDLGIWGFMNEEPYAGRWMCWFGVGTPTWQPTIEINLPTPPNSNCSGQIASDVRGHLYLCHRGGLGGGKYAVRAADFCRLIEGFEREIVKDGERERPHFVLCNLAAGNSLQGLARYVKESHRIRQLRRDDAAFQIALSRPRKQMSSLPPLGAGLSLEQGGEGTYSIEGTVTYQRLHDKVQKALVRAAHKHGLRAANDALHGGIKPDLYTLDERGGMQHLFEIKVDTSAQAIFTAIGQLAVYSSIKGSDPKKILVTQGLPKSRMFSEAMQRYDIRVLNYRFDARERVILDDLASVLGT